MYDGTIADKANATFLSESEPKIIENLDAKVRPGKALKRDIDTRFYASSDFRQYGLSNYTIEFIEAAVTSRHIKDPNGDSS